MTPAEQGNPGTALLLALVFALLSTVTRGSLAADVPPCSDQQVHVEAVPDAELEAHRQFALPVIDYPFGTELNSWGMTLRVVIDESGKVACYGIENRSSATDEPVTEPRRALIASVGEWRYEPFRRADKPASVIAWEHIEEQEAPAQHIPMPDVPLERVHITLERTGCFGTCPSYKVDLYGDGRAVYTGVGYVDVMGEHRYRVAPQDVARLVESIRSNDVWSLRSGYQGQVTDNPTYEVTIDLGGEVHTITDYVGEDVGMPASVTALENQIDKVARTDHWLHLSQEAVAILEAERFRFTSRAGADLLARAVTNEESHDDEAMLRMVQLGSPVTGGVAATDWGNATAPLSLIEAALRNRRAVLIDALLEKNALKTSGRLDQRKLDRAFQAAIAGGSLALVQKIWDAGGDKYRPALVFDDRSGEDERARKSQVSLLLHHSSDDKRPWDGLAIAQWLATKGCDIKATAANGDTLLHIAAEAGDVAFVRYLLGAGIDASTLGEYGLPALGGVDTEDVALVLLEAGTDLSLMNDDAATFRRYAKTSRWQRVLMWLDKHGH